MSDQLTNNYNPSTSTIDALTAPCHRCGRPSGGSYLGSLPTCVWCLAGLKPDPTPLTPPTYVMGVDYAKISLPETIKVKYLVEGLEPLEYIGEGISDWVDLRAAENIYLKAGDHVLIPLGVAIELPKGYEAIFAPRSSAFKNWGILQTNSIGVIDEAYCGNKDQWMMSVYATRNACITKNDRVCQFRIVKHQPQLIFETVETLGNEDRSGFGSTGHK